MKIPKITLLLCFMALGLNSATASNVDPMPFTISAINFSMDAKIMKANSIEINFHESNGNLHFTTQKQITFLQIFNEDYSLEYQLPVFGKSIVLDLDDLKKGNYKMNLVLEGDHLVPATFTK